MVAGTVMRLFMRVVWPDVNGIRMHTACTSERHTGGSDLGEAIGSEHAVMRSHAASLAPKKPSAQRTDGSASQAPG